MYSPHPNRTLVIMAKAPRPGMVKTRLAAIVTLAIAGTARGAEFYVSPTGSAAGDGSEKHPVDLRTALSGSSPANPGDTIWVRGGTYFGTFDSVLHGNASAPIIVRAQPGGLVRRVSLGDGAQVQPHAGPLQEYRGGILVHGHVPPVDETPRGLYFLRGRDAGARGAREQTRALWRNTASSTFRYATTASV